MQLLKPFLLIALICVSARLMAQENKPPRWLSMPFSSKVSLQTAFIKIDNKDATYSDLLKVQDSGILKVEVYSKKEAQQFVDKEEAKNGLVLVTLHKKHLPRYDGKKDSAVFIIESGDTIYCGHAQAAMIDGDTTNMSWLHFLERSLNSQAPADNGAPAGLYNVDITFQVNKDGTVSDVNVIEDPGYGTGAEVKRLMNKSLLWTPAMCDDRPVIYRQRERISFHVSEE